MPLARAEKQCEGKRPTADRCSTSASFKTKMKSKDTGSFQFRCQLQLVQIQLHRQNKLRRNRHQHQRSAYWHGVCSRCGRGGRCWCRGYPIGVADLARNRHFAPAPPRGVREPPSRRPGQVGLCAEADWVGSTLQRQRVRAAKEPAPRSACHVQTRGHQWRLRSQLDRALVVGICDVGLQGGHRLPRIRTTVADAVGTAPGAPLTPPWPRVRAPVEQSLARVHVPQRPPVARPLSGTRSRALPDAAGLLGPER